MDFGVSNWILGNLCGKGVHFITYYSFSTCFECKWEHLAKNIDTPRANEGFWMCVGHLKLFTASYLRTTKHSLRANLIEKLAKYIWFHGSSRIQEL